MSRIRTHRPLALLATVTTAWAVAAQERTGPPDPAALFGSASLPQVELPPERFATAEEHYRHIERQAGGGTPHTDASVPKWRGLWTSGFNTLPEIFIVGGTFMHLMSGDGEVRNGVLTPAYERHFLERRAEMREYGQQRYDRLTACEYPGVPRWLMEPYVKEFVNTPEQSWFMNDFMNETRRIYIGREHVNIDANHSATGDSIGFWDGDRLIVWTKWVNPADYFRGMPLTSNQFEMVETWHEVRREDGSRRLVTQVTFYDPIGLLEPQSAVFTHDAQPELEASGVRIRNWECASSSNAYRDEDGNTQFYLPGDPQYKDPRGFTDFPDVPGQSFNPIFDEDEQE